LADWKEIQASGSTENFIIVGSLKFIWAVHKVKWTWQFAYVVLATLECGYGNRDMTIEQCEFRNLTKWTWQTWQNSQIEK
jgi:hypothetical protein